MGQTSSKKIGEIVRFCASHLRHFTSDHIYLLCQFAGVKLEKWDVSSAILHAKGQRLIKRTDNARISDQFSVNSLPRFVWRSLIGHQKEEAQNV